MWANMAAKFGWCAAGLDKSYSDKGYAQLFAREFRDEIPELQWLHAIKNAGHGDAIRGARNAAEGIKPGVPDMFLPVPIWVADPLSDLRSLKYGLYIELKRPKSNGKNKGIVGNDQTPWMQYLSSVGYAVDVCYGWVEAKDALLKYLGRDNG